MKYNKIIQKPYCCVGACLEAILNRHNIENTGQEDIAYQLGLIVPEEDKNLFKRVRIGEKPNAGYGTQIQKEEYSINNYFVQNNIPLEEEYYFITDLEEANTFLFLNNDNDILICMHCGTLYDKPYADWGHMVLFENIKSNEVTILEVSPKRDYESFPLDKLLESISIH